MRRLFFFLLIVATLVAFGCSSEPLQQPKEEENVKSVSSAVTVPPGTFTNNGVYLASAYVTGTNMQGINLYRMLEHFRLDWQVNEIYVNVGYLTNMGVLKSMNAFGQSTLPVTSSSFIDQVRQYETYYGYPFKVYAWFNGRTDKTGADLSRPDQAGWRTAFSATTDNFVMFNKPYTTATSKYDGIMVDFEPSGVVGDCPEGGGPQKHECLLKSLNNLRLHLTNAPGNTCPTCSVAVSAQKWAPGGPNQDPAWWNSDQWWKTAQPLYADTLVDMPYRNNSYYPYSNYRYYMANQVEQVLRSVRGLNTPFANPPPANRRVKIGFPAFGPNTGDHPVDENVKEAAIGTMIGYNNHLNNTGFVAGDVYMGGAAMYAMHTGFRAGFQQYSGCWICGCLPSYFGYNDDPNNYFATIVQDWQQHWLVYWVGQSTCSI